MSDKKKKNVVKKGAIVVRKIVFDPFYIPRYLKTEKTKRIYNDYRTIFKGMNLSLSGAKATYKTLKEAKPEKTFEQKMERELISESDLRDKHKKYITSMWVVSGIGFTFFLILLSSILKGMSQEIPLISMLTFIIAVLIVIMLWFYSYLSLAIRACQVRNKTFINPLDFLSMVKEDISHLSLFEEYEDTFEKKKLNKSKEK